MPGVALPDDQRTRRRLAREGLLAAALLVGKEDRLLALRVAVPLVTARHNAGGAVLPVEIRQHIGALRRVALRGQRLRDSARVRVQRKVALAGPLHPAAHGRQHRAIAEEVGHERDHRRIHQRLGEHVILEEDRVHPIAEGRIDRVGVRRSDVRNLLLDLRPAIPLVLGAEAHVGLEGMGCTGHHIGTLAVAALGDIDQGVQHPPGEVVRVRDLGRDHAEPVGIETCNVFLQAEGTNVVPCALARFKHACCFCHDVFPPRDLSYHSGSASFFATTLMERTDPEAGARESPDTRPGLSILKPILLLILPRNART